MRLKGGGRVRASAPRRERRRLAVVSEADWFRDAFDEAPAGRVSEAFGPKVRAVVEELVRVGAARLEEDRRDGEPEVLREVGLFLGRMPAEVVVEVINHFAQRGSAERTGAMVVLGAFVGALFVEFWAARGGQGVADGEALEAFVSFLEETEGQPARRLAGTLYGT